MEAFSERVRARAYANEKYYPEDSHFISAVEALLRDFEAMPQQFDFTFHPKLKPEELGQDAGKVFLTLIVNLRECLRFCLYTTAYKVRRGLLEIVTGLNTGNYLGATQFARVIIEESAAFNNYYEDVVPQLQFLLEEFPRRNTPPSRSDFASYVKAVVTIIELSNNFTRISGIAWENLDEGGLRNLYASAWKLKPPRNLSSFIDKLPKREPSYRFYWSVLSDFVHPNSGSRSLFTDSVSKLPDGRISCHVAFAPQSDLALAETLHFISSPIGGLCLFLERQLLAVQGWIDDIERRLISAGCANS